MNDETLDHLAAWCRLQRSNDDHAFALYCAMLDGIRADPSVMEGNPDWKLVSLRCQLTVHTH